MRLYKCNTCGKIVAEVETSGTTPMCCNEAMTLLTPKMTDGALEKHMPVYDKMDSVICVTVGEVEHPMTALHHVDFVILGTNMGYYLRYLYHDDCENCFPGACFHLAIGEEPVSISEYCNVHGLYVKEFD